MRGVGEDRDVDVHEGVFDGGNVQLLLNTATQTLLLIFDCSMCASHDGRWKRSDGDGFRGDGAHDIDHESLSSDVFNHASMSFAQSAADDVDAVHDDAPKTAVNVSIEIQMLGHTRTY